MRYLIFIFTIILFSCETAVDPKLPNNGTGVVFYSFFRPGSPIKIDVFNTIPILQSESLQREKTLTISLLQDGELVEEVTANPQGVYVSTTLPVGKSNYSFKTTRGKEIFSATSQIPEPVHMSHVHMSDQIKYINSGTYGYPAEISLADQGETTNFYSLEVLVQDCSSGGCTDEDLNGKLNEVLVEELKVNTSGNTDVDIGGSPQDIDGLKYIYFNDEGFNGKSVTLKFFVIPTLVNFNREQNIKFVLKSITKEYYEYLRTSDFQQELEESGNFAEPVQIATNIENGLGTFSGYSFSLYTIKH